MFGLEAHKIEEEGKTVNWEHLFAVMCAFSNHPFLACFIQKVQHMSGYHSFVKGCFLDLRRFLSYISGTNIFAC